VGARPEQSDNKNLAVVALLAGIAVQHIRRGMSPGIRTARKPVEGSEPARRVLSSECRILQRSNPKAVHPIQANKRRVVSWLVV
jgi:hypothetical protein